MYRSPGLSSHRGGRDGTYNSLRPTWRGGSQFQSWHSRRGWWNKGPAQDLLAKDMDSTGDLVTEIKVEDVENVDISTHEAKISNVRHVASYSLIDSKIPKIIVPGEPALWTPPTLPMQLKWDQGEFLRDENGARFSEHPMLPAVQSIFATQQPFKTSSIDVLGCASSLANILRFTRSIETSFRFDVEFIGNTLFLIRNAKDEKIEGVKGYGHSFLDVFTTYASEVDRTKSHQRVIRYRFGDLEFLVRFECDAYDTALSNEKDSEYLILQDQPNMLPKNLPNTINMEFAGHTVLQKSLIEIKTRSQSRGTLDVSEHLPRLWIRQIPNLVAGYHNRGIFEEVQKTNMSDDILKWEKDNQPELRNFGSVMKWLVEEVKRANHSSLEVYRKDNGPLQLRKRVGEQRRALPEEWSNKWSGLELVQSSGEESSDSSDDQEYPSIDKLKAVRDSDDDDDDDDDTLGFDYTACDLDCGICRRCAF